MKIYKVIYKNLYMDECEDDVDTKIFLDKEVAYRYLKKKIERLKNEFEESEDYIIEETKDSYSRYLDGRYFEDSISIWITEDETYDEKEKNSELEAEYEI